MKTRNKKTSGEKPEETAEKRAHAHLSPMQTVRSVNREVLPPCLSPESDSKDLCESKNMNEMG